LVFDSRTQRMKLRQTMKTAGSLHVMPQLVLAPRRPPKQQLQRGLCVQRFKLGIAARHHRPRAGRGGTVKFRDGGTSGPGGWSSLLHTLTLGPSTATPRPQNVHVTITQSDAQKMTFLRHQKRLQTLVTTNNGHQTTPSIPRGHDMFAKLRRIYIQRDPLSTGPSGRRM